jgi:hypothetical protein
MTMDFEKMEIIAAELQRAIMDVGRRHDLMFSRVEFDPDRWTIRVINRKTGSELEVTGYPSVTSSRTVGDAPGLKDDRE